VLKLTLRGLVAHKLRFLLTGIAVVLGVAFVTGTLVFTDTVKQTFDDLFANVYQGTDAWVRSRSSLEGQFGPEQRQKIPASVLDRVRAVDGVAAADGNVQIDQAQYLDDKGKTIGNPGRGAPSLGFNWSSVPKLNAFTLVDYGGEGSHPPRAASQIVMDKGTADAMHSDDPSFGIGSKVTLVFPNPNIAKASFDVVGVVTFGGLDRPAGATVAIFTTPEAQRLDNSIGRFDAIAATASPGVDQQQLQRNIEAQLPHRYQVLTGEQITKENQNQIEQGLSFFTTFLLAFAFISLFVGAFIIVNTFSIVVAQRTRELALLRAMGASGRQVRVSVIGEALGVGVVASVVGILAGIGMSVVLRSGLKALGLDIPSTSLVINTSAIVAGLAVGIIVTLISSIFPARRAARIPPMAALREMAVEERNLGRRAALGVVVILLGIVLVLLGLFGSGGIAVVGGGAALMFIGVAILGPVFARPVGRLLGAPLPKLRGMAGTLARENAVRNPRRTASTAAALMIGVALVGLFSIFASSAKASISSQIDRAFRADLVVLPEGGGFGSFSPKLARQLSQVPDAAVVGGLRFAPLKIDGKDQFLASSNPRTINDLFDLRPKAGNIATMGPDDIAVSKKVFDDNGWKLGQQVHTQFPVGGTGTMRIAAVYGFGAREGLSDYFIGTNAYDRRYTELGDNQVYVKLKPGVSVAEARPSFRAVVDQYPGTKLSDQAGLKKQFESQVNQLLSVIFALLALALIIALIGIMNTLLLSIVERTREIGLLRAVGMTRKQIKSTVRWEAVIVAVFGALLGLVIGLFLGWSIVRALHDDGITQFAIPGGQIVLFIVLAGIAGVVAAAYPARRASRLDVLEAISTE
jgi:putative ABC transport system permease protein